MGTPAARSSSRQWRVESGRPARFCISRIVARRARRVKRYDPGVRVVKKADWQKIIRSLEALENTVVQVGWFNPESARIAFINDRGGDRGDNPPPRPVLAPGMDAAREHVTQIQAGAIRRALRGGTAAAQNMGEEIGQVVEQAVRDAIEQVAPPNAPSTVAGKHGYSAPLRGFSPDRIWQGLTYRVVSAAESAADGAEDDG